jgi:hypothetical protein
MLAFEDHRRSCDRRGDMVRPIDQTDRQHIVAAQLLAVRWPPMTKA